jgi:hypothetical protein
MGAAARARHAAEFTWEHVAGQYEQLLLKTLDRYHSQPAPAGGPTRTETT